MYDLGAASTIIVYTRVPPGSAAITELRYSSQQSMTGFPHFASFQLPFFRTGTAASLRSLKRAKKLSVVIPCYNETGNLQELVRRLADACEHASATTTN